MRLFGGVVRRFASVPRVIVICLCLFVSLQLNSWFPVLRFNSRAINEFAYLASWCLPWVAFALAFFLRKTLARWATCILLVPLLLGSFLAVILMAITAGTSFEPIHQLNVGSSSIVVYRLDGGATTDFGLLARQERQIIPGLYLVRNLETFYPAYSASCETTSPETALIKVAPYEDRGPLEKKYTIARFVYF